MTLVRLRMTSVPLEEVDALPYTDRRGLHAAEVRRMSVLPITMRVVERSCKYSIVIVCEESSGESLCCCSFFIRIDSEDFYHCDSIN